MENIKKINHAINHYLQAIDQLQKTVFSFYIKRDYYANQLQHEKKLLRQAQVMLQSLQHVRDLIQEVNHIVIIPRLEHIYEIIFSLDLFKHRLLDHATFEICEKEFQQISQTISAVLSALGKRQALPVLDKPIQTLKILFQNTLQFAVADPSILVFFVRDLDTLNEEFVHLHKEIQSVQYEH